MRRGFVLALLVTTACGGEAFTAITPQTDGDVPEEAGAEAAAEDAADVDAGAPDVLEDARREDARADADAGEACAPVMHANGFGGGWTSCEPRSAYSAELAMEACASYFGPDAGVPCHLATCGNGVLVVEGQNAACIAWAYAGPVAGYAVEGANQGPCVCPTSAGMAWY